MTTTNMANERLHQGVLTNQRPVLTNQRPVLRSEDDLGPDILQKPSPQSRILCIIKITVMWGLLPTDWLTCHQGPHHWSDGPVSMSLYKCIPHAGLCSVCWSYNAHLIYVDNSRFVEHESKSVADY